MHIRCVFAVVYVFVLYFSSAFEFDSKLTVLSAILIGDHHIGLSTLAGVERLTLMLGETTNSSCQNTQIHKYKYKYKYKSYGLKG